MPQVVITNLPLDEDGHQFWVSAVDHFGNENVLDMPSTGYVPFPQPAALTISNVTNIYTDYSAWSNLPASEQYYVYDQVQPLNGQLISPMVVVGLTTTARFFSHFEIEIDTAATFNVDPISIQTGSTFDGTTHTSRIVGATGIKGTTYYFRARVFDQLGNSSTWSNTVSEVCGDSTAPNTVGSSNVDMVMVGHSIKLVVDLSTYTQATDHDYYEWWLNTSNTHPGGNGIKEYDVEFMFANKSGQTLYAFVAAVDRSGNRSANYTVSVATIAFDSAAFWDDTGNVTDLSGDPIIDVTDRGIEDENGVTVIDFTSDTGINATLEGAIDFGTGGKLLLTDNTVSFSGTPVNGTEIIARGMKLYGNADNYAILEKTGSGTINVEIMGGSFRTGSATSYLKMDSTGLKGYNAGNQRVQILSDGSGWFGADDVFFWDTAGNVTFAGDLTVTEIHATSGDIAGWDITASEISVSPVSNITARLNSAGYISFGDPAPTTYGNNVGGWLGIDSGVAKLSLYNNSSNYLQWNGTTLTVTGASFNQGTITAATFQTASSGARVVIDTTDGIRLFNVTPVQTVSMDTDGSGWFGLTGTKAISWTTAGAVTISGFSANATSFTSTNIGLHAAGYSEGAELLLGHATLYASAKIGLKADGSGKVASGNFIWDTSGNVTIAGSFTSSATITGGTIKTSGSNAHIEMDSTNGIRAYNSTSVQTVNIATDGSGWFGLTGARAISWTTAGVATIGGFTAGANSFTSTLIGLHSAGYSEGAEILLGHATAYSSAKIGLKADGSGKIASGNFIWDTSGNVTMAGNFTSTATITGGTIRTGSGNARVEMTSANGIRAYNSSAVQTVNIGTDGSGWFGLSGTQSISWNTSGAATIGGWSATADLFRSATSGVRVQLDASKDRVSIFDAVNEKVVMGYLEGLVRNNAAGNATGGSSTYLDDTAKDWEDDQLIGLTIAITGGTGSGQSRTITDNTATRIYASFSPAVDGTSDYEVRYPSNYYGFWAMDGDELRIDGDVTYESGDWIVHNDASLRIIDGGGHEIIRLGTASGEKGLFIYDTGGTPLAKYISDEIYIGAAGNYLQYTTAGGLIIEGDVTVSATAYPRQPFDKDSLLILPLDSFPIDQSGNNKDGSTSYGSAVTYVDGGVGSGYCTLFPNSTASSGYHLITTPYANGIRTWTFWTRSTATGVNEVFRHGGTYTGRFTFNNSSSRPIFVLDESNYRYWVDNAAQDDGLWHFWCLYLPGSAQSDITNCKLYVDLTEVTVYSTTSTLPQESLGNLQLGYDFDGYLQDFRVYDRELTLNEMAAIYGNPNSRSATRISGNKVTTGTIQSTNWSTTLGSQFNLDSGTFYLGGSTSPKLSWNGTVLGVNGSITITGGSGIANLTDANLDNIANTATYGKTTLNQVTGAGRAYTALNSSNNLITAVLPASTPTAQTGLNLTSQYMGYYNGSSWMTFMTNTGNFYLGGTSGELQWDGTTLLLGGDSQLTFGTRLVHGANILAPDIRLWHLTTTPDTDNDMGYWTDGSNPYGGDDNNAVVNSINPFGKRDLIWQCTPTAGDTLEGGWGYNSFDIDKDLRYRYSLWVKKCGDHDGVAYFGCYASATHTSNLTADGSDSGNSNPYFISGINLPNTTYFLTNAVTNGTMEADANWTSYGSPTTNARSAVQKHSGTYSRLIVVDAKNEGIYSDVFTVEAYQTYILKFWAYGDGSKWEAYIYDGNNEYPIKEFGDYEWTARSATWIEHVLEFQPTARSTTARLYIVSVAATGTIYIDDVVVSTNIISNGDMEFDSGWSAVGTPTTNDLYGTTKRSGSYSRRIIVNAASEGVKTTKVKISSGTTTSTLANKLVNTAATFTTDGTAIGDIIRNDTDDEATTVTNIDSATTLSIANDIFTISEAYTITQNAGYMKLITGRQYRAVIWLYGNAATQWSAAIKDGTNTYSFLETNNTTTLVPAAAWTKYTLDFEAKLDTTSAYMEILSISTSGTLYIDDVTFQETPWYLFVGFLHPDNYAGTESWGGIYHYKTGLKQTQYTQTDFKSMATTTLQGFRGFFYNSSTVTNQQYMYSPAVYVVDGSEPSLASLLGNSIDIGWNIENTTNISKYLISSPTIRGGNFSTGNYVQIDESGINAYGNGVNTFNVDAATGDVTVIDGTITGGTIQTSSSGARILLDGSSNRLSFYDANNDQCFIVDADSSYGVWILFGDISRSAPRLTFSYSENSQTAHFSGVVTSDNDGLIDRVYGFDNSSAIFGKNSDDGNIEWYNWLVTDLNANADGAVAIGGFDFALVNRGISFTTGGVGGSYDSVGDSIYFYADSYNKRIGIGSSDYIYESLPATFLHVAGNSTTSQVRIGYNLTNYVDILSDSSGYLNITPSGDKLRLWESAKGANDYTDFYTDTSGLLTIAPYGAEVNITGNIDVTGSYKMDNADIINTDGEQTGVLKVRSYLNFSYAPVSPYWQLFEETEEIWAYNAGDAVNAMCMPRAGKVTGISLVVNCVSASTSSYVRAYLYVNETQSGSFYVNIDTTSVAKLDNYATPTAVSFSAGDRLWMKFIATESAGIGLTLAHLVGTLEVIS